MCEHERAIEPPVAVLSPAPVFVLAVLLPLAVGLGKPQGLCDSDVRARMPGCLARWRVLAPACGCQLGGNQLPVATR